MELLHLKKTLPRFPLARGQSGMSSQREQQLARDLRDAEEEIASLRRKLQQQVGVFCAVVEQADGTACVVLPAPDILQPTPEAKTVSALRPSVQHHIPSSTWSGWQWLCKLPGGCLSTR